MVGGAKVRPGKHNRERAEGDGKGYHDEDGADWHGLAPFRSDEERVAGPGSGRFDPDQSIPAPARGEQLIQIILCGAEWG
jgi:hypothetical protein